WLAWCEGNHDGCRVAIGMQPSHPIRLVDCKARSLVQHDGKAPYVALSYVWGKHTEESTEKQKEGANSPDFERGKLPENITAVIEDAMVVTQQLGYQLLWVDRYCIDQEDRISADQQINQMDRIYNGAEITLVAAAGEDGNYGLAGVNREFFARLESSRIETGPDGAVLMSITSGSSTFSFEYQKWSTRGWTFQEALLSRRCLVFTENWIFFQC
ncbi:HET-domain-containing protein, partial [Cryphonectria parasitica EP155]